MSQGDMAVFGAISRQRQADTPAGPPVVPDPLTRQRPKRRARWGRAVLYAYIAIALTVTALQDSAKGLPTPAGAFILAASFGLLALYQLRQALRSRVPRGPGTSSRI
jgi:hypothetical protein